MWMILGYSILCLVSIRADGGFKPHAVPINGPVAESVVDAPPLPQYEPVPEKFDPIASEEIIEIHDEVFEPFEIPSPSNVPQMPVASNAIPSVPDIVPEVPQGIPVSNVGPEVPQAPNFVPIPPQAVPEVPQVMPDPNFVPIPPQGMSNPDVVPNFLPSDFNAIPSTPDVESNIHLADDINVPDYTLPDMPEMTPSVPFEDIPQIPAINPSNIDAIINTIPSSENVFKIIEEVPLGEKEKNYLKSNLMKRIVVYNMMQNLDKVKESIEKKEPMPDLTFVSGNVESAVKDVADSEKDSEKEDVKNDNVTDPKIEENLVESGNLDYILETIMQNPIVSAGCAGFVTLILAFFAYKLYNCLLERERKREEKKKLKMQKKKK